MITRSKKFFFSNCDKNLSSRRKKTYWKNARIQSVLLQRQGFGRASSFLVVLRQHCLRGCQNHTWGMASIEAKWVGSRKMTQKEEAETGRRTHYIIHRWKGLGDKKKKEEEEVFRLGHDFSSPSTYTFSSMLQKTFSCLKLVPILICDWLKFPKITRNCTRVQLLGTSIVWLDEVWSCNLHQKAFLIVAN